MVKYYTRVCNFYLGKISKEKVKQNTALPLNSNKSISFDTIEIITRKNKKKIHIRDIKNQNSRILQKIKNTKNPFTPNRSFTNKQNQKGCTNI